MADSDDERVQPALHAVLTGDVDGLRAALEADPGVVNLKVGENTMLEWMTQPEGGPPSPEIVEVLINAGAYLDRALNLAGCWNLADLCTQLLVAGADPAARADAGITPLESAAMHSSTDAADVLVAHGLHRPSLWLAAASGLLADVQDWVGPDRSLLADPGPYRPNWADVGRPAGEPPTDGPDEIVGEALVFAALNNRRDVVDYLLDAGTDIDARPYRNTTGLHFRHPVPAGRDGEAPAQPGGLRHHRGRQPRIRRRRLDSGLRRRERRGRRNLGDGRRSLRGLRPDPGEPS